MNGWIREILSKDGTPLYELPGFVDFHFHTGWTDFNHQEQEKRRSTEISQRISFCLQKLNTMGFRLIRDAGGLEAEHIQKSFQNYPAFSVIPCCGMVNAQNAHADEFHPYTCKNPGKWVKLFATGGIGASQDTVLIPTMNRDTFFRLTEKYHKAGKLVMVHTWGGDTLDWSIEAGVDSVEHGVYMTRHQASCLAEKGILYVPTAAVYQLIASKANPMKVPPVLSERAAYAAEHHQKAIYTALQEGVRIGCGTDFYSDPSLLPYEYEEIFALESCGIPHSLAWQAFCGLTLTKRETGGSLPEKSVFLQIHPFEIHSAAQLQKAVISQPCVNSSL